MRQSRLLPLIIATALFMENTDSTVISTSLPMIAETLGTDPIALKLALTSYLVSLAIFIPISGWMADKYGARTIFTAAIGVFMAGSLACAASTSLEWFVIARFVQGAGGAMMVPVGRLVLLRSVPRSEVVQALATLTIPALVGPIVGPPLGGFITTYFHWRWIFFINIPIGILGIVMAMLFVPNIKEDDTPPLDIIGFLLSGFGFALLMLGFASGGRHLIPAEISVGCVIVGAICLVLYVFHARRTPFPVLQLGLLKIPTFRISVVGGFLFRIGIGAIPFLLPLMLQVGFGLSPLASGSLTFIAAVGALFMKTMAKRILERTGFRRLLTVNAFIGAAFVAANGFFSPDDAPLADHGHPPDRRLLPLAPVHEPQRHRLRGYLQPGDELCHEPVERAAAGLAQHRRRLRRLCAGVRREPRRGRRDHGGGFRARPSGPSLSSPPCRASSSCASRPTAGAEMSGHKIVKEKLPSTGLGDGMSGR